MVYNAELALRMVKHRLDYMQVKTTKDEYLTARIDAAARGLEKRGIHLTDNADDLMLLVDVSVWEYQSRDRQTGMPEWLRMAIRERFLSDRARNEEADGACS